MAGRSAVVALVVQVLVADLLIFGLWRESVFNAIDPPEKAIGGVGSTEDASAWAWVLIALETAVGTALSVYLPPLITEKEPHLAFSVAGFFTLMFADVLFYAGFGAQWTPNLVAKAVIAALLVALERRARRYDPALSDPNKHKRFLAGVVALSFIVEGLLHGLAWGSSELTLSDQTIGLRDTIALIHAVGVVLLRRQMVDRKEWTRWVFYLAAYSAVGVSGGFILSSNTAVLGGYAERIYLLSLFVGSSLFWYMYIRHILFYIPWDDFPFVQPRQPSPSHV